MSATLEALTQGLDALWAEARREAAKPGSTGHGLAWHLAGLELAQRVYVTEQAARKRAAELAKAVTP